MDPCRGPEIQLKVDSVTNVIRIAKLIHQQ